MMSAMLPRKGQIHTRIVRAIPSLRYPPILDHVGRPDLEEDRRLRLCALQFDSPLPLSDQPGPDLLDAPEFGELIHLVSQ